MANPVVEIGKHLRFAKDQEGILWADHRRIGREKKFLIPVDGSDAPFDLSDGADMPIGKTAAVRDEHLHDLPLSQTDILCDQRNIGELIVEATGDKLRD